MKKIKIMLSAIAVFAVVGGALAFKAKSVGGTSYCITTDLNASTCNLSLRNAAFGPGNLFKFVQTFQPSSCASTTPSCTTIGNPIN